ncbi:hypothetical protein L9F63_013554, partial [Diploptera punctata]
MDNDPREDPVPQCETLLVSENNKSRPLHGQAIVALMVYLTAVCNGLSSGHSAILLPQLRENSSSIQVNEDTESWIVSVYIGATSLGCLLSGIVLHAWGRKRTVQISVACNCIGWILISVTNYVSVLLVGRTLGGFGKGLSTPAVTFHLEEVSDPRMRGTLSACILLMYSVGIMIISMLGTDVSWKISAGLGAGLTLLNLLGYSMLVESPVWLIRNNHIDQAQKVYSWLWGSGHELQVNNVLGQFSLHENNGETPNQIDQIFTLRVWKPILNK